MQQIMSVWSALEPRRRVIVVLATIAMFAAVLMLSRIAITPSMTLLYGGLESGPAGEIIRALDQRGATYEVRGGSIFVESNDRDELRMTLAGEGLPTNSVSGYELLDSLSGFGTTSQMFDAAYWRAKEGELARTIVSSPYISSARVHIANPTTQPFRTKIRPTASVTVTSASGTLSGPHAKALKYLVASAVSGLAPEDVSIIDSQGGLILGSDEQLTGSNAADDRAGALKESVERLLEAHVGYGNAVVEVSVETITERQSIVERTFDPASRVAISTDTEERSTASEDARAGSVTVASNLPEGDTSGGNGSSSSTSTETREQVNFEVSETSREIHKVPGAIKRLSVAVLVDGTTRIDSTGAEVFEPRSEEEMKALHELVASAVGYDEARGDTITMKSLAFEPIATEGTAATPSLLDRLDLMSIIQLAVLALVSLILGMFVVRPILANATSVGQARLAPPSAADALAIAAPGAAQDTLPTLTGEIAEGGFVPPAMSVVTDFEMPAQVAGDAPTAVAAPSEPAKRLRQMIEERQEETVGVLRSWMEDSEERV